MYIIHVTLTNQLKPANQGLGVNMKQEQQEVKLMPVLQIPTLQVPTPQVPFMHPDKFAEQIGLSKGVVGGWIDQGYVPTIKVGKYRMINLIALTDGLKLGVVS